MSFECNGAASVVCLSVCLSVNFCANRFFSQTNGRIATKLAHDGLQVSMHPGVLKVKVKVKGHVIRALFLDSRNELFIDGLVCFSLSIAFVFFAEYFSGIFANN